MIETLQIRHPKKVIFLEAFRKSGIVGVAARSAGIHRDTHYDWLNKDPVYAAEYKSSQKEANDALLAEVLRRAVGNDASDTMLIVLLKMRGLFVDRREHTGEGGGPIKQDMTFRVEFDDVVTLTPNVVTLTPPPPVEGVQVPVNGENT